MAGSTAPREGPLLARLLSVTEDCNRKLQSFWKDRKRPLAPLDACVKTPRAIRRTRSYANSEKVWLQPTQNSRRSAIFRMFFNLSELRRSFHTAWVESSTWRVSAIDPNMQVASHGLGAHVSRLWIIHCYLNRTRAPLPVSSQTTLANGPVVVWHVL